MKTNNEITVLLSVYKKEKPEFLLQAMESIVKQTLKPKEFLIIKDGELTPELDSVIDKFTDFPFIKVIGLKENRGLGLALKFGVEKAQGTIIARMDSDDIANPKRLETQYNYMVSHPDISIVGSNTIEFIDKIENVISTRIMPEKNEDIIKYSKTRNPFIHPSVMIKKESILNAGNYRDAHLCEDYDLWYRIFQKGNKAYNIQDNLVYMRTSNDFYKRRGGIKYCKSILKFKKKMYKEKYISRRQYFISSTSSLIISLMPSFLRKFIYKKFLRK